MPCWLDQDTLFDSSSTHRRWCASEINNLDELSCQDLDELIEHGDLLKHDATTTVARISFAGREIVVKRYNPRSQWHRFSRAVRQSRASRSWRMSYAFEQAGLSVARPLLMLEKRLGPLRRTAYFLSEALSGYELLSSIKSLSESEKKQVVLAMKNAFTKMRLNALSHGDLNASNLIWQDQRLFFIDMDSAKHHQVQSSWVKANKKDQRRFLKNWQNDEKLMMLFKGLAE